MENALENKFKVDEGTLCSFFGEDECRWDRKIEKWEIKKKKLSEGD